MIWSMLCNAISVTCFTFLAIHFEKWWIALFAILFMFSYKSTNTDDEEEDKNECSSSKSKSE